MEKEGESRENLGGSLPVQNVYELATKNLNELPSRYIRPDLNSLQVCADGSHQIQVVNMSKLGESNELGLLHTACQQWGFFQVYNNQIK